MIAPVSTQSVGAFGIILDPAFRVLLCHRTDRDMWILPAQWPGLFSNFGRAACWVAGSGFRVNATAMTLPPPRVTPLTLPLKSLVNFTSGANQA